MHERSALLGFTIGALSFQASHSFLVVPTHRGLSYVSSSSSSSSSSLLSPGSPAAVAAASGVVFVVPATIPKASRSTTTALSAANFNSNDPFEVLDLAPSPTLDKKQIKRAYKRLALQYHPDVATNQSSTPEEKKRASDLFSKINWAYETLSGKNGATTSTTTKTTTTTASSSSSSSGYQYQPPHRRTTSNPYTSSNSNSKTSSTDSWNDFMPNNNNNNEEEDYDSGGDSFGQIFSDLFTGVAAAAAAGTTSSSYGSGSSGGIFRDFVDFLERNVDVSDNDVELMSLLQMGTLKDVRHEMDDTDLVVEQLSSKLRNIDDDLIMVQAERKQPSNKYMRTLELEERVAELEARKKVVKGYLQKARKRLVALQTRYKELIVGGANDDRVGRSSRSQRSSGSSSQRPSSDYGSSNSGSYRSSTSTSSSTSSSPSAGTQRTSTNNSEDAWKQEGFGSSGRGRGSSRRRASSGASSRSRTVEDTSPPPPRQPSYTSSSSSSYSSPPPPPPPRPPRRDSSFYQPSSSSSPTTSTNNNNDWSAPVPPHRRASVRDNVKDDTKRMRELKVDEEFEKLKRDLGLS